MERDSTLAERARQFRELMSEQKMREIDFDALVAWFDDISPVLSDSQRQAADLTLLRQDLEGRITGMTKALAAVDRKGRCFDDVLAELDVLPQLSAHDLVACYRRTAAQFRDSFPASYGIATPFRSRTPRSSK